MHDPETDKKLIRHQNNNAIVKHSAGEIIPQDNKRISVKYEAHENIGYEVDKTIYMRLIK